MSVDFNSTPLDRSTTPQSETPMFAPIPSWERNKKRRGLGAGKRDTSVREPTVFDAAPEATYASAPDAAFAAPIDEPADATFAAAPAYATRPMKKSSGMAPLAIAAGIIAVGGLAAAGWYAAQPRETGGMAQLTPGTQTTTAPIAAPEMAAAATTTSDTMPATTPPQRAPEPAAAPVRAKSRLAAAPPARARPAQASRSAEEAGVNTSATLPAAPQPYSGAATAPQAPADVTPTPAAPAWNIPPAAQSAAPAPVEAAPPSITPPAAATPPVATPPN